MVIKLLAKRRRAAAMRGAAARKVTFCLNTQFRRQLEETYTEYRHVTAVS
jgi:hypothetical protein